MKSITMLKILLFIALSAPTCYVKAQHATYNRAETLTYFQNMDFENGLNWLKNQPINDYIKAYLMDVVIVIICWKCRSKREILIKNIRTGTDGFSS
ncbi:hypothetical protein [Niabella ginsengisoli]|uniref:Uncharacterized protein n=1 Tax=Niabella ginsengisoli TaxID=522298 RepID=A0ABS9SQQ9_9BACT|nr:hypothetical protein [Niabella ginsengisoli]MCH5600715.1 hypothetical protein [Niabella ginsengisoli]